MLRTVSYPELKAEKNFFSNFVLQNATVTVLLYEKELKNKTSTQMSDESVTWAFTGLRRKLLRLASRFLPDEEEANDALQEAFCRLWPKRDEIHSRQEAEALSVTTVRNLAIDALRKRQSATVVAIDEGRDAEPPDDAESERERREQFEAVETIINRELTALQQTIVRRREYEGDSFEDIAADLGMQEAAVRMQLSRARKTIRMCYLKLERQ